MADEEFKIVGKSKKRPILSPAQQEKRAAWLKFRAYHMAQIARQYKENEVRSWMEKHPGDDRELAKKWSENNWDTMQAETLDKIIAEIEPRACKDAWKRFELKDFALPDEPKEKKRELKPKKEQKQQATSGGAFDALATEEDDE